MNFGFDTIITIAGIAIGFLMKQIITWLTIFFNSLRDKSQTFQNLIITETVNWMCYFEAEGLTGEEKKLKVIEEMVKFLETKKTKSDKWLNFIHDVIEKTINNSKNLNWRTKHKK